MNIWWRGHFDLSTARDGREYIEYIVTELSLMLARHDVGAVSRSSNTLRYRRGFDLGRFARNSLQKFDPGEITVRDEGCSVRVEYALGLIPDHTMLLGPILVIMAFVYAPFGLAAAATGLLCALIGLGTWFEACRVRRLLRASVSDAVDRDNAVRL